MLAQVSFSAHRRCCDPRRGPELKPSTGGVGEQTLKNEKGAMLVLPCASMLDTQAIGRGMMASRSTKVHLVGGEVVRREGNVPARYSYDLHRAACRKRLTTAIVGSSMIIGAWPVLAMVSASAMRPAVRWVASIFPPSLR